MKRLNLFLATILSAIGYRYVKNFLDHYEVVVFDKDDFIDDEEEINPFDLRGTPTHECICGSNQFYIRASFDNYELAQYFLDMQCVSCGSLATAPTPVDKEKSE